MADEMVSLGDVSVRFCDSGAVDLYLRCSSPGDGFHVPCNSLKEARSLVSDLRVLLALPHSISHKPPRSKGEK